MHICYYLVMPKEKTKFSARATIKLTNQSKEKIYYELIWFDNPKFYLEATPAAECIRPVRINFPHWLTTQNSSIEVTLDVRVFCTTRVYQMIQIHLNKSIFLTFEIYAKISEEEGRHFWKENRSRCRIFVACFEVPKWGEHQVRKVDVIEWYW